MPIPHCTRCQQPLDVLDVVNGRTECAQCRTADAPPAEGLRGFLAWKRERPAPPPEPTPTEESPPQPAPRRRRRRTSRSVQVAASITIGVLFLALHLWLYHTFSSASRAKDTRPDRPTARADLDTALAWQATHPKDTDGAVRRFEAILRAHPDTPAAEQAVKEIERLKAEGGR